MHRKSGFTLIELIIAMAVVGILAAIALPSYSAYINRSNRAEAKSVLLEASSWLERRFNERSTYLDVTTSVLAAAGFGTSPRTGTAKYQISIVPAAASYTLTAQPVGSMASDSCGALTINNLGQKTSGGSIDQCWAR